MNKLITILIIISLLVLSGCVILLFVIALEDVSKNRNEACQKLGYDKFLDRGFDGKFCVDTSTGERKRVIGICGASKESCVFSFYGRKAK